MRYLKLFEGFDTNQYYWEISFDEFTQLEPVDFDENLLKIIEERLSDGREIGIRASSYMIGLYGEPCDYYIGQSNDEWFYAYSIDQTNDLDSGYYKCDQFEGLLKFLEDKGIIKKDEIVSESMETDKLYWEISQDDYCLGVYTHRDTLEFDKKEKEEIQKRNIGYQLVFKLKHQKNQSSLMVRFYGKQNRTLYIEKLEDEWFYVAVPEQLDDERYYKCDQFDGLLKFLEDKGIIK
jgi:hypothetical protein